MKEELEQQQQKQKVCKLRQKRKEEMCRSFEDVNCEQNKEIEQDIYTMVDKKTESEKTTEKRLIRMRTAIL